MKKALHKGSNTSDEDSHPVNDDETDTEQNESLPHDHDIVGKTLRKFKGSHRNSVDEKKNDSQKARKSSVSNIKSLAKLVSRKDVNEHPTGRFKIEKVSNVSNNDVKHSPNLSTAHVVAEDKKAHKAAKMLKDRRRSILQRQNNLVDTATSPLKHKEEINYKIVNEKNQQMEKRAKLKTKKNNDEPEIFKFDSDLDNVSYQDTERKLSSSSSSIVKNPSSNDTSWNQDTEETCRESISPRQTTEFDFPIKSQPKDIPTSKPMAQNISPAASSERPKRRFSSFIALVREVVQLKKQEKLDNSKMVKKSSRFIPEDDDVVSATLNSSSKRRDSRSSSLHKRTKNVVEKPGVTKRTDSQGSIWSENIPVITISKTESAENILEGQVKQSKVVSPKSAIQKKSPDHSRQSD